MKLKIFATRDRATVQFSTPMFLISEGQCIRGFTEEVNRKGDENALYNHPDDFDLYALGDYDTETGLFESVVPVQVVTGKQVKIRN